MTSIYFIRHAEADNTNSDGRNRPLTEKGINDRTLVTEFLLNKNIDVILSSPFKRAVDTVADFAEKRGLTIELIEDFREHYIGSWRKHNSGSWIADIDDFISVCEKQWADFSYKYPGGESLVEVQERNISALNDVLSRYDDKNIVIGTHGAALSTIINYFDKTYICENFMAIINLTPWVVRMDFNENGCIGMEKIDLFQPYQNPDYSSGKVILASLGALKAYRFVVIFTRYKDKWLYCRMKDSDSYGNAGGHLESGETPLEAAKRELFEETGALKYKIKPVFDYSVHIPTEYSNGQVFLAHVQELGELPDYEIAEVKLFDTFPDKMRFPQILPVLYESMQEYWVSEGKTGWERSNRIHFDD